MQALSYDPRSKEELAEAMIPNGQALDASRHDAFDPDMPAGTAATLPHPGDGAGDSVGSVHDPRADRPASRGPQRTTGGTGEQFTLTKAELAEMLFERVGLNKREAKDMVETFFDEIRAALERGESVKLSGFGNFQLRDKPQRPGRNPKTGEEIPISARRVVTFHASQKLKAQIEGVEE